MCWKIFVSVLKSMSVYQGLIESLDYILAENKALKSTGAPLRFTDEQRMELSLLARKIPHEHFANICMIFRPETVRGWYAKILAKAHTYGKEARRGPGRPSTMPVIVRKVIAIASENRRWGYTRIQAAIKGLGHTVSRTTIKRILESHGMKPIRDKKKNSSWHEFLRINADVFYAGDFFTVDILSKFRAQTYYVLFFIHLKTRTVHLGGITQNPNGTFLQQVARNMTMEEWGPMQDAKYLLLDNDKKFTDTKFRQIIEGSGITFMKIPPNFPNLNPFAERWVQSIKTECLDRLMLFRERSLRYAVDEYINHYNSERPHQSLGHQMISGSPRRRASRLGGLLRYYGPDAA